MPQFVLRDEQFELVQQLVAEAAPHDPEVGCLLNHMNTLVRSFEESRYYVEKAKKELKSFHFTIDFETEVFEVDPDHAWVNGWYLVRREKVSK